MFNSDFNYINLRIGNTTVYVFVNWVFLLILMRMIWKIRHIEDDTLIKRESTYIVGLWIFLSMVQTYIFMGFEDVQCDIVNNNIDDKKSLSQQYSLFEQM